MATTDKRGDTHDFDTPCPRYDEKQLDNVKYLKKFSYLCGGKRKQTTP